jgi:hypothetical protein
MSMRILWVICFSLWGCGSTTLRLTNAGTSEGPLYTCDATSCETSEEDDPERINLEGAVLIALPAGCAELEGATLYRETPSVEVVCGESAPTRHRCAEESCVPVNGPGDEGTPIALPTDCGGRIHEVLVVRATEDEPTVFVQCDTSSRGIEEM